MTEAELLDQLAASRMKTARLHGALVSIRTAIANRGGLEFPVGESTVQAVVDGALDASEPEGLAILEAARAVVDCSPDDSGDEVFAAALRRLDDLLP